MIHTFITILLVVFYTLSVQKSVLFDANYKVQCVSARDTVPQD